MEKKTPFKNPAFSNTTKSTFHLAPNSAPVNELLLEEPLTSSEIGRIDQLLKENGTSIGKRWHDDALQLQELTAQIRAVAKMGVLMTGERIYKARELLKPYRDGTFTKWISMIFPNRKSGYNMLAYYELYLQLPSDCQESYKKLSRKVAYVLASRPAPLEVKVALVRECASLKTDEGLIKIQTRLPVIATDGRGIITHVASWLKQLEKLTHNFESATHRITAYDQLKLAQFVQRLQKIGT